MNMNDTTGFFNTTASTPLSVSNIKERFVNIPAAVFIAILSVIGITGNATVLYVYILKFKLTTFNIFITFLAACDFVTCALMPIDFLNLLLEEDFYVCKINPLTSTFSALATGIILLAIAVIRYKGICNPLNPNVSLDLAKRICLVSLVFAGIFSWPSAFVKAKGPHELEPTVFVMKCIADEHFFKDTLYPLLYHVFLFLLFIITFVTLAILYGIMGLHLRSRMKRRLALKTYNANESTTKPASITESKTYSCNAGSTKMDVPRSTMNEKSLLKVQNLSPCSINEELNSEYSEQIVMSDMGSNISMGTALNKHILNQESVKKKTELASIGKMLFIVTITFLASYLPYLSLSIFDNAGVNLSQNCLQESVVGISIRSYLISRTANPIIYGCCNKMFRDEINQILHSRKKGVAYGCK